MALSDAQFTAWLSSTSAIRTVLVEAVARIAGSETTLYLSSRNYITAAADTPASTAYQACIAGGVSTTESLNLDGSPSMSWGDIEIGNTDGSRDGWLDYVWANRSVNVYVGDPTWPRADFRLVFSGVVDDLSSRARDVLNLKLRDKLERLNAPLSEATLGGSTDNKDRLLPLVFGEVHNIEPLLITPATLVYQYSTGASERLIEVRDNGAPITTYTSDLANGKFTLTAAPATDTRAADIADLCARHGVPQLAAGMIRAGTSTADAGLQVLAELARRDAASGGHRNVTPRIETVQDEMQVRLAGIEQAILHRVSVGTQLDDNGRRFRGMSLLEMGRSFLEAHGQRTEGMDRLTLASRMLHFRSGGMMGTSDFSSLFANVANKRLRAAYDENAGTYALWARRAPNAPDFKSMNVVQLAGAPDLLQTNEAGEFRYGSMSDGAETYAVLTYGRIVTLTRQAIINDDLRAFERLVTAFGFAARRLENRTVYSQLTANAALADGTALFHANHSNLITSSALAIATLGAGRTAMRLQKGLQSEELNLAPAFLIVPATLEQTAYNLTSANYVPSTKAEINEFRAGGRTAVTPVVEPVLDANSTSAWYLAASSAQVDTVEYCYLDGAEGPVIESEVGFETDGVSYKCRLDFAAKAVDYRGLLKATA